MTTILKARRYTGRPLTTSVRLPKDMVDEIDRLAKKAHRSRNDAIETYLEWALEVERTGGAAPPVAPNGGGDSEGEPEEHHDAAPESPPEPRAVLPELNTPEDEFAFFSDAMAKADHATKRLLFREWNRRMSGWPIGLTKQAMMLARG